MNELKKCPFCGGEAKLEGRYREWDGIYYDVVYVYCTLCGCQTSDESIGERKDREQKSIEKWNTRKPVDDVMERLERKIKQLHNVNWNAAMEEAIEIIKEGMMRCE